MKNLLFILILFGLQGYGQKTLEIYNFSTQSVRIYDIVTSASGSYPEFHSYPSGLIIVPPSGSYTLVNTSSVNLFPLYSPSSSQYIHAWYRLDSPTSSTTMSSPAAYLLSSNQFFDKMVFAIDTGNYIIGTANPSISGSGWNALYDVYTQGTTVIHTIVFF